MAESADGKSSEAMRASLDLSPGEKAQLEAENGVRQFDRVLEIIDYGLQADPRPLMRPEIIKELQLLAVERIVATAGNFRSGSVGIKQSQHEPPPEHLVPGLVQEMCDYLNSKRDSESALHLAAYALWRLNWIHPFVEGNGRTARCVAYIVLCLKLGYQLPGREAMPALIAKNRDPYYEALQSADEHFANGRIDLTDLETYLGGLLASQLMSVIREAGLDV